jgi:hypothetical protein
MCARVPCGSRTHLASRPTFGRCPRLAPLPLGQGHVSGGRGSRTLKVCARLFSRQLPSPVGLSLQAAAAGVEPAIVSLTGSCLTVRPHRNESVRVAGFEPAISGFRRRRNARLSHTLISKSTQRESNPHIHHGKAAGSRYIMGAKNRTKLSRIEEHWVRLEPTSPHYGCGILAAGPPVPICQWDQRGSNPHRPG